MEFWLREHQTPGARKNTWSNFRLGWWLSHIYIKLATSSRWKWGNQWPDSTVLIVFFRENMTEGEMFCWENLFPLECFSLSHCQSASPMGILSLSLSSSLCVKQKLCFPQSSVKLMQSNSLYRPASSRGRSNWLLLSLGERLPCQSKFGWEP